METVCGGRAEHVALAQNCEWRIERIDIRGSVPLVALCMYYMSAEPHDPLTPSSKDVMCTKGVVWILASPTSDVTPPAPTLTHPSLSNCHRILDILYFP